MLMTAPAGWLNELAEGPIRTQWGLMMQAEYPAEEASQQVYQRLKPKLGHRVAFAFETVAPLLAERLAIAEYKLKNPAIEMVAPEVLDYQEALEIAMMEVPDLTPKEQQQLTNLLKKDKTMQVIPKLAQTE